MSTHEYGEPSDQPDQKPSKDDQIFFDIVAQIHSDDDRKFFSIIADLETGTSEHNADYPREILLTSADNINNLAMKASGEPKHESIIALLEAGGDSIGQFHNYAVGVLVGDQTSDKTIEERINTIVDTLCQLDENLRQVLEARVPADYRAFNLREMGRAMRESVNSDNSLDLVSMSTYIYMRVMRDNLTAFTDKLLNNVN